MRRLSAIALLLLLASPLAVHAAQEGRKGRALSLRELEATLKAGRSPQARTLCGITRLLGFVVDPADKDIILVGRADPAYPELQADDLVVALRYAHLKYATRQRGVLRYSPPGCSIDPDPEVIGQLRRGSEGRGRSDEDRQAIAADWEAVGRQPQKVRVLGVPFDTHFAKVMVDADYYMKRLSDGSEDLDIAGFTGLVPLRVDQAKAELASEANSTEPASSLNRFWFCPAEATYEENDNLLLLRTCQVKLLTEEEFLTARGQVQGLGRPSPLAQQFADGFTRHYGEIAEARPIYKELEALFRFVAVARLIKDEDALARSGNRLSYLLSKYQVQPVPVDRTLPGQTRVVELRQETATDRGTRVSSVTLMSCGGVNMDVRPKKVAVARTARTGRATGSGKAPRTTLKKTVLASRTSRKALSWDFPLPE